MSKPSRIERYALYGEPAREAELRFMHVERVPKRSGAHEWSIKPHAHAGLHQILLLTGGGGSMRVEAELHSFTAPALLIVPAGRVHAFEFSPETDGLVITVAESVVTDASRGDPLVAGVLEAACCLPASLEELAVHALPDAFEALAREFTWAAPARTLVIEAHLVRILVGAGRLALERQPIAWRSRTSDALLVERFLQRVERDFRERIPLAAYADALGVTESRLSAACHRVHDEPAIKLILRRRLVEAQRALLYTNQPVSGIGFALGFQDPSYFARFFIRHTGETPSAYRAARLPG